MQLDNKAIFLGLVIYFGITHFPKGGIDLSNLNNIPVIGSLIPKGGVEVIPTKERVVAEPTADLKAAAQPIADIIAKSTTTRDKRRDAFAIGDYYGDFNKYLVSKGNVVKSNIELVAVLKEAGKGHFQNVGFTNADYPGIGDAIDAYFAKTLGTDAILLDTTKTSNVLTALQWSVYQTAK